jgi:hypothetical protein
MALITKAQLAQRVNRTPVTVMRWSQCGALPKPIKPTGKNSQCLWDEDEVEAAIQAIKAGAVFKNPSPKNLKTHPEAAEAPLKWPSKKAPEPSVTAPPEAAE